VNFVSIAVVIFKLNDKVTTLIKELSNIFAKLAVVLLFKSIVSFEVERVAFASFKLKKF